MTEKHAHDYIKKPVNYQRPFFNFPDLSSEYGNAFHFWPLIHNKLTELGFKKEATFFSDKMGYRKYNYKDMFQLISFYLDFNPANELYNKKNIIKEDDDYVYIKVKKELYHPENNIKQPFIFKIKDIETLRSMTDEDFSIKNCYGRTFLNYIDNPTLMNCFLQLNEEYKWIDLIDLDNFNGSYLHSVNNLECFAVLFKTMSEINPYMTEQFLFGKNVFEETAYDVFIKLLSERAQSKEAFIFTFTNEETINTLSTIFTCLKKINEEEFEFLKNQFTTNSDIQSFLVDNDSVQNNLDKMFLRVKLENKLDTSNKKLKIKNKI